MLSIQHCKYCRRIYVVVSYPIAKPVCPLDTRVLQYSSSADTLLRMENTTELQYTNLKTKKLANSELEISASIPAKVLLTFRKEAIDSKRQDIELPGFRKGHVPEDMLIAHIGESSIMEQAGNKALSHIYPKIILAENIDAIGSPRIQIIKLANGNDLEFTATTAIMPKIELADYKKIAKKIFSVNETFEVTDDELKDTLTHIRRQRAQVEYYEKQKKDSSNIGGDHPEVKDFADTKPEDLPELTDEFVQTLGDFKTAEDFKTKVRENILEEKKLRGIEKKRIKAVEDIITGSKIELPDLLVEQEIGRIQAQMEADVTQTGTKLEDYLKNINKTMEDLHKDWRSEAEKRAKLQLILNKIAKDEKITLDDEEVKKEITHIKTHYPDADEENIRIYVETTKSNEMAFKFLETLK